jgi:hypothetical protein
VLIGGAERISADQRVAGVSLRSDDVEPALGRVTLAKIRE